MQMSFEQNAVGRGGGGRREGEGDQQHVRLAGPTETIARRHLFRVLDAWDGSSFLANAIVDA